MLKSVDMISTFDIKLVHETFNDIRSQYTDKSVRFQFFLATCLYLDAHNNLDFISKKQTLWWFNWNRQFVARQALETFQIS